VDSERVNVPRYDTLADDRDENERVEVGGECGGRGIDAGSTVADPFIRLPGRSLGECVGRLGEVDGLV